MKEDDSMEITLEQSKIMKTVAILMMVFLHVFNTLEYKGLFEPLLFIGAKPLVFYISLFGDACVPIFAFVSGYGLYLNYEKNEGGYRKKNYTRLLNLYINYWVILLLFVAILGGVLRHPGYPGGLAKFLLNATAIVNSYNGAWWFFLIYLLLTMSAPWLFAWVKKTPALFIISSTGLIYLIAFYFRIYRADIFQNEILKWLHTNAALYGCTLFPFVFGSLSAKYKYNSQISALWSRLKYPSVCAVLGILGLMVLHALIPNFIIAPLTGILFIFLFNQLRLRAPAKKGLVWMSAHATNIWLIHMFFYMIYFKDFIYSPKYVLPIFLLLIVCCTMSSVILNYVISLLQQKRGSSRKEMLNPVKP